MSSVLIQPTQSATTEGDDTYRALKGVTGLLAGEAESSVPLLLTGLTDNADYAVTLQNQGTGGHLNVPGVLQVNTSGVVISTLTATNLIVTGTATLNIVNASGLVTLSKAGLALSVTNNATIGGTLGVTGTSTLGTVNAGSGTFTNLTATANTAFGDANADVMTVIGTAIFKNVASAIQLYVDGGNNRVVLLSATPLGSDTTPAVHVVGRLYVAPESANDFAFEVRRSSAATVGWRGGVTSTNDFVFKDLAGTETFRAGAAASTYQAIVTGQANITNGLVVNGSGVLVTAGGLGVTGSSVFNSGLSVLLGLTVTTGNLAVSAGGISAGASSTFTGGVTLTNSILTLTGGQISFPAAQVASADANTLDDYAEGPWTPSIGGSATYTTQIGRYTKVGRLVTIQGEITINALGTGSVNAISGLPFSAATNSAVSVGYWDTGATAYVYLTGFLSGSTITLYAAAAATVTLSAATFFKAAARVIFQGTYVV